MVYNDWGLSGFVQMLTYKYVHLGKEIYIISERDTTRMYHVCQRKHDTSFWKRTYRGANCGLVIDRDESILINIYKRFLARLGHTLPDECGVLS